MFPISSLSHNSFQAAWQLFGWLLFHPSAWREYLQQIDTDIAADFAWHQLSQQTWQHPKMQRLRYLTLIIWPLMIALVISLSLLIIQFIPWTFTQLTPSMPSTSELTPANFEIYQRFFADLILGVTYGTVLYLVSYMLSSYILSVPFALVASVLSSISVGLLLGSPLPASLDPLAIIFGIFALSIAGNVITELHTELHQADHHSLSWQIGSWVVGTGIGVFGGIVISITILFIVLVTGGVTGWLLTHFMPHIAEIKDFEQYLKIIGMAVTLGLFLGYYLYRSWQQALKFAGWFGAGTMLLMILILGLVSQLETNTWEKRILSGLTGGTINASAFVILFTLPYLLAQRFANTWAGVIAGILGSGGIYLGVTLLAIAEITSITHLLGWLMLGILAFSLGISQQWWLPILSYPFESATNLILARSIQRQNQAEYAEKLLAHHSAFWHEHQWLPLHGLEALLVNIYKLKPEFAEKDVIPYLRNSQQSWAVKATTIESNMQKLDACKTLTEIGKVHNQIVIHDDFKGDVGNSLRHLIEISEYTKKALQQNAYDQLPQLEGVKKSLNASLIFMNDKRTTEINRFREITDSWLKMVDNHIDELINVQTLPNPYVFGPPVEINQGTFVTRPNISKRIENLLQQSLTAPLLLYGQRRTGKTSLLKNLFLQLPPDIVMLFVDIQGPLASATNNESFFYNFIRMIIKEAKIHYPEIELPPLSRETLQLDPITYFDEWLDELETKEPNKIFFLALDEFITLDKAFEEQRLELSSILGIFRNLIQHRKRFRLLFSGTHSFEELQHWASYLINVNVLHLNYLLDDEAEQLIEYPQERFPLRYTPEAKQRVMAVTHNHPGLIQLLCGEIVTLKDRQTVDKRLLVELADIEAAIPIALEIGSFFFSDLPNQIDQAGEQILRLMAAQGEGAIISQENLMTLELAELETPLKQLLQRELIEKAAGGYRFQIELIRQWFSQ